MSDRIEVFVACTNPESGIYTAVVKQGLDYVKHTAYNKGEAITDLLTTLGLIDVVDLDNLKKAEASR